MIKAEKLTKIVGAANVSQKPAVLEEYAADMSFVNMVKPEYVVKPKNSGDIAKLVKLANDTRRRWYR